MLPLAISTVITGVVLTAVLGRFDGTGWRADATPITSPSRLARLDMAVDPDGVLWVWHEGEPATLWRFDGSAWSTVRLPFDVESTAELPQVSPSVDPFATFLVAPDGALWLFDRDRVVTKIRHCQIAQEQPAVRVRIRAHPPLVSG